MGWEDKVKVWKGVYQIAWKTVLDCLETIILMGNELASFIIYLREITFNVKKPMQRLELDDVTVSRHLILMS